MGLFLTNSIKIPLGQMDSAKQKVSKLTGLPCAKINNLTLYKQSVDARKKDDVHFVCSFLFECNKSTVNGCKPFVLPKDYLVDVPKTNCPKKFIVVGAGPSGLFAALYLSLAGHSVTVIERGKDIDGRKAAVSAFFNGGALDENTNVQFGLGGAGAFSDGKLTTGISSPLTRTVFSELVRCGAPADIMYSALPHVGTDNLYTVVGNLRDKITSCGGKFLFETCVTDFLVQNGVCVGVQVCSGNTSSDLYADAVLLCCGHSARNIFKKLVDIGVETKFKPFAVGVRIEHTRQFIDNSQYGLFATHRDLSAASYKLVHNGTERSCYSFCMCPGGVVVAASSEQNSVVVNGMSCYARNADNSNSALVVTVNADDMARWGYGSDDALCGMRFQRDLERKAFNLGCGNYVAPCQNAKDFQTGAISDEFSVQPSYPRGVRSANLRELFPTEISDAIADGLRAFNGKIKGFGDIGVLTGVETRTSSPVKICRDSQTFQSSLVGLYPIGEGAGYAGGIVSAAVDGLRVAKHLSD